LPGMTSAPAILIAEDDEGHAFLIQQNLKRAGLNNRVQHFHDGQAILDFLFDRGPGAVREPNHSYLLQLNGKS